MGLDLCSLGSGFSNRVHDSASTATGGRRIQKRESKPTLIISTSSGSLTSLESTRRRRKPKKTEDEDFSFAAFSQQRDRTRYRERKSIYVDKSMDALDSGKTEHTSNLTEYSRRIGADNEIISSKADEDDSADDVASLGEQSVHSSSGEFTFQSLLSQWKTRERQQKERTEKVACDMRSRASYLDDDEDHSCFEGVLKHWKKRDRRGSLGTTREAEVFVDDEATEVSSLGDSYREQGLRWGYESDSRFDFAFDARFDSAMEASPSPSGSKKKLSLDKKKKKKSGKKREESARSKKKKTSDSKTRKKKIKASDDTSCATFDAAMDAAEAAMDGSVVTLEDSVASMDTSGSKKKKKKKKSKSKSPKSKSPRSSKSKKTKTKKSSKTLDTNDTDPLSDDEGSKDAYLPNWLSPQDSPRKKITVTEDAIPVLPNLSESPKSPKKKQSSKQRLVKKPSSPRSTRDPPAL